MGHQFRKIQSRFLHRLPHGFLNAEVDQVAAQVWPQQKFRRQIGHHSHLRAQVVAARIQPALHHPIPHGVGQGQVKVVFAGHLRPFALDVVQVVGEGAAQGFYTQPCAIIFNINRGAKGRNSHGVTPEQGQNVWISESTMPIRYCKGARL